MKHDFYFLMVLGQNSVPLEDLFNQLKENESISGESRSCVQLCELLEELVLVVSFCLIVWFQNLDFYFIFFPLRSNAYISASVRLHFSSLSSQKKKKFGVSEQEARGQGSLWSIPLFDHQTVVVKHSAKTSHVRILVRTHSQAKLIKHFYSTVYFDPQCTRWMFI